MTTLGFESPADKDCQELANRVVRAFLERHPGLRKEFVKDWQLAGTLSKQTRKAVLAAIKDDMK